MTIFFFQTANNVLLKGTGHVFLLYGIAHFLWAPSFALALL